MKNRIVSFFRRSLVGQVIASLAFLLISFSVVSAVTTISTTIYTGGNIYSDGGGLFNVASTTALNIQNGSGTGIVTVGTSNGVSGLRATGTTDIVVRFSNSSGTNDIFRLFDDTVSVFAVADGGVASGTTLRLQEGAVGTPSFSFANDSNTGMYSSAADTLDFATGGTSRLSMSSSGLSTSATTTITAGGEGSRGLLVKAAASQAQNLFELQNSSSAFLTAFTASGGFLMNISSTTAFNIQNGSGATKFVIASASGNATTSGFFVTGATNPVGPNAAGDMLIGGNASTTGNFNFTGRNPFIIWSPTTAGDKVSISSTSTLASLDIGGTWTTKGPQNANGSPDVAEYIMTRALKKGDRLPEEGDVVALDKQDPETAVLSTKAYSASYLGIIADGNSSFVSTANGLSANPNARPLALMGRVRVKVTSENGIVRAGDFLTGSATKPGYAMKATKPGYVIGKALRSMTGSGDGMVMVFISNIYAGEIGE